MGNISVITECCCAKIEQRADMVSPVVQEGLNDSDSFLPTTLGRTGVKNVSVYIYTLSSPEGQKSCLSLPHLAALSHPFPVGSSLTSLATEKGKTSCVGRLHSNPKVSGIFLGKLIKSIALL